MSLEFNADKQELRSSNLKFASSDDLTIRSGAGTDEKEVMRFLVDPISKLPRVGVNRTGRRLEGITLQTAGSGYTTTPDIIISAPDDPILGIQATATAIVLGESVSTISVDNPGFGYNTAPTVTISGGGGSGASATARLDTVDYELDVNGAIRTSTSIISDTARILNLDIENFVTPDINFRAPDLKIYANNSGSIWEANTTYPEDTFLYFGDNVYRVENSGRTGTSAPLFKDGSQQNGDVLLKHIGYRVDDQSKPFYGETIFPRSVTPPLGDRSDRIATTEYVLNLATNDVGGRVYVSQEIGNDANNGRSAATPVRTIKRACQIATSTIGVKETVIISGGDYSEDNPISIPPDCSVVGDNLRLVIIRPKNPRKHMFKFADKNYISGIVFRDKLDSEGRADETWDFAVAFDDKQRLYYEPSAGGDFLRNFEIGHQIFGKEKYRITFQDHTGRDIVAGEPVGSFLTIGATIQGVNSSAIGTVIGITYFQTTGANAYLTGTVDIEVVSGSFNFADIYQYDVGTEPNVTTYEFVSNDLRSIRAEGEVVFHGTEQGTPISITRIDGSLQGDPSIATGGFGGDDDLGGIVFYTNPLIGRSNTHDFKEGAEVIITGLVGDLSVLNGVQRIYKVIEDDDGRARRFVIPKKLPSFTDDNFIPVAANVRGYSHYVLVSLLNSPNIFEPTPAIGRRWQDATNLIKNSIEFIKDETYLQVTDEFDGVNYTTFTQPDPNKCRRDIGHFVYSIIQDLQFGSNFNVIEAAKRYVAGTQIGYIGNEITETVRAFEIAKDLCKLAVRNWHTGSGLYSEPQYTAKYSQLTYYTDASVIEDSTFTPGPSATCSDVVAAVDTLGYLFIDVITNNAADRYLDASELIARNEELILEEVVGEVSTQYPDFYYPDTNPDGYRFKDARNLIYANEEEIKDRALVEIGVEYPDFYFPGDPQTTSASRYYDAYRFIQKNRDIIAETALASIETNHPTFVYPGADGTEQAANKLKCRRDIGHFIDAVSLDIGLASGNKYTRQFILQYFNGGSPISNGLVGEEAQSNTAFSIAAEVMNAALTNTLSGGSTFTNATYATIAQTAVTSSPFNGVWLSGDTASSKTIYSDLTITADPATGSNTSASSCANVQSAIDALTTIVTDAISAGSVASLPAETSATYQTSQSKCRRDIGYIVKAVANDLYNGGNSNIILATKYYFDGSGNPINNGLVGEEAQSVIAFNKARDVMKLAVTNQLYVKDLTLTADGASNTDPNSCANVRSAIDTLVNIITDAVSNATLANLPATNLGIYVTGENVCKRDLGYILSALRRDMTLGGNAGIVTAAEAYFTGAVLTGISQAELPVTRYAFEKARDLCILAVRNWHTGTGAYSEPVYTPKYSILPLYTDSTVTEDTSTPTCADVVSSITTSFTTLDDILAGGTPPTKTYGTLYNTDSIQTVPELSIYDVDQKRVNVISTYMDLPIIEASPYIQNASVISFKGGGGCEIDGNKVKQPNCPFPGLDANGKAETPNQGKSMVAAQFTIVSFNGTGYKIVNDGYTQLVSVFVLFAKDGVVAESGGYASITNSATNFGIYALRATGYREEAYSFDIGTVVSTNITPNGSTILRVGGLGREPLEHYVVKFEEFENQDPNIEYFVDNVSQVTVGPPFTASLSLNAPILIQNKTTGVPVLNVDDATMVGKQVRLHRPSIVNSSSHTWEYAGSGTDYNALPENGGTKIDGYEQVSENYGRVYVSGTDELGDFKVGTFAKIENRTGNITFTGTVSISEVEFLKLKGGDVVVTGFSAANDLGGAFSSNSLISTQKAVKDYIGNNLGPYLNKPYSTNAVPRALVELTDSGKISLDQIPALRPFNVYTVADEAERLSLEGPLAGDIAIQGDTNTSYILQNDLSSQYIGINVDGSLVFTNGQLVTGSLSGGVLQVTNYVQGVVYQIQIVDGGSGYTSAPTVTLAAPPSGVSATATATIADGKVILVTITENAGYVGGYGYTSAPSISFSAPGAGGTTASANALIESRVYGDIVNQIKIADTDTIDDHAGTPNTVNVLRAINTSASDAANWVSLSTTSVSVGNIVGPGKMSTTLLGSGSASSFTFLAGDQTYKPVTQTIKALENRYFLKTISASNTPSQQLVFQADSQLLIGHEVIGTALAEDTTIAQIVVSEGEATITLSQPIQSNVSSGTVIEFKRPDSPLVFSASNVKINYIDQIVIANPGSGYTDGEYFGVDVSSGGTGTGCIANIVVTNGGITSVIVTDGGTNFTTDYLITPNPVILGPGNGLSLLGKIANSVKNSGVIGMDIRRVDDKTLDADPYGNAGIVRFLKSDTATGRIGQFRFVSGGGVYIDQGPDSGFDADKLDGQHGNYYLDGQYFIDSSIGPSKLASGTYSISISGQSGNTIRLNTQTTNSGNSGLPNTFNVGITSAWKTNLSDGLTDPTRPSDPDSGYHGVITFRQFGESNDSTGGGVRQLAFTDKNNLWVRGSGADVSAWSDWRLLWSSGNDGVGSGMDSDLLDGKQGTWYQNGRNINFGRIGASHLPELLDNTHILETLSVKNYPGNSFYDVYVSGQILNTFPFQVNQSINLYDSNSQGVGSVYVVDVITDNTNTDPTEHYTILRVRLDNGGFGASGAIRIGTASINVPFNDYTPSTQTTYELASLTGSGGQATLTLGALGVSGSPELLFRSSGNNNAFDSRIVATGGGAAGNNGQGSINVEVLDPNSLTLNNNIIWNEGNVTFQVGLSSGSYNGAVANGTAVIRDSSGDFAANNITASLTGAASLNVLRTGDVMSGNLTVGSTATAETRFVRVLTNDANNAGFEAYGNSQGTGYLYVGQSATYGGGLAYNGDGSPAFATGELADRIAFYRKDNGTNTVVFQYPYNSNTVTFTGRIESPEVVINGGTANATNDATVYITATNNNDWGLIVDKYNGSANEYGLKVDVGSGATYAIQVRGNDSETFRVNGAGGIFGTNLTLGSGDIVSARNVTLTGSISLTANSTRITQNSTSTWSGNAGNGVGKLEYHSNRWYINAGTDSTEVVRFRRGASDVGYIDNSGNAYFGSSNTATITAGYLRLNTASSDGITITSAAPTICFQDTNHRTGYIHVNSNLMYFLCGATNAGPGAWAQVANSRWPLYLNLTNNQAVFGGDIDANTGNIYARTFRTPAASFGNTTLGNNSNNNNYVLYANGDRQWLDTYGVVKANRQTIGENLTIPTTLNASSVGPITINNGNTVYVGSGGTWTVL